MPGCRKKVVEIQNVYEKLNKNDKKLFEKQVETIELVGSVEQKIVDFSNYTKIQMDEIKSEIKIANIITIFNQAINNIVGFQRTYIDLNKLKRSSQEYADKFKQFAVDVRPDSARGLGIDARHLIDMLVGGNVLQPDSIYSDALIKRNSTNELVSI